MFSFIRLPLALTALLVSSACTGIFRTPEGQPCGPPSMVDEAPLDDQRIIHRIEAVATRLIREKKVTPAAKLRGQLKRKSCRLALAEPSPAVMSAKKLYRERRAGVVIVAGMNKCDRCTRWHVAPATGFVISADGAIVTSYHVLEKKDRATYVVGFGDGRVLPVREVLAASKGNDLAILRVDPPGEKPFVSVPVGSDVVVGSPISIISHPDRKFYMLTRGIVSRRYGAHRHGGDDIPMFSVTADFSRGSSGAPVFDESGSAVGVVASTHSIYYEEKDGVQTNLQMVIKQCIPASSLLKLIKR